MSAPSLYTCGGNSCILVILKKKSKRCYNHRNLTDGNTNYHRNYQYNHRDPKVFINSFFVMHYSSSSPKILISPSQMFFPVVVASIIAPTPLTARNQGLGRLIYLVVAIPISTAYLSIKGFLGSMEKVCLVIAVVFPIDFTV